MFFFNKKQTIAASGILQDAVDHHSHILPGVDDGVETMAEALRILAIYEALGIKELWLTPHIMEDIPNTPQKLSARFNELKAAYTGNITLHLAAEYMIDNNLHKLIQKIDSPSLPRGAVQSKPCKATPPLFRGEVVEDRRGEEKTKESPLGLTKGEGDNTNNFLYSLEGRWHELSEVTEGNQTNNCPSYVRGASDAVAEGVDITNPQEIDSPSLPRGAVQSKPFQETPPLFRGEVVEDRRGEKKTTECLMRHELSEVTEGNQTNNCPSYVRGASDAVAEGVDITNTQVINSPSKREYPKGEGVETNKLLPIGTAGKHILVETSYFTPPMRLHETLRKIKSLGYHPILAHPERYMYMEKEEYLELHEEGIKFQLNLASLAGGYGKAVKKKAEWLLKKELYSIAGSDLHCEDAIEFITGCRLGEKEMKQVEQLLHNCI